MELAIDQVVKGFHPGERDYVIPTMFQELVTN